ncbi:MAG: endonuclease/exonuclease/phosphatase family protein [Sulfurifustis sp.]
MRLLTLNLNYRVAKHGAWEARRARIVETARAAAPDVLALQAVEDADGCSQATELAAALDFPYVYFVAAMKEKAHARGSAFLARFPLADLSVRHLTRRREHEDTSERVLLRVRVDSAEGAFDLYNAHLSWVAEQAMDNVRELIAFAASAERPALLLGDLNNTPESAALRSLREAGWIDVWDALHPGEPGHTFEADQPRVRIDYALVRPDWRSRIAAIERVTAEGARPRLSDHFGLIVTVRGDARAP